MGSSSKFGKSISEMFRKMPPKKALMLGLDSAGKSTILYKIAPNDVAISVPTIAFTIQEVSAGNLHIVSWDIGYVCRIRQLWSQFIKNAHCLIMVIDASERERIQGPKNDLHYLADVEELRNKPILIFINKTNFQNSMSQAEIALFFEISKISTGRKIKMQRCSATTNEGLLEGFQWIASSLSN